MILPQFTAPGYMDRTLNEVQRCVNLYPEKTPSGYKLIASAGYELFASPVNGVQCRGWHRTADGRFFTVNGNVLYEYTAGGSVISRGTMGSVASNDIAAYMADNGIQLLVRTGNTSNHAYTLTLATNTWAQVTDVNFPSGGGMAAFIDGYIVVNNAGTGLFYVSQLNDATDWTPVQFATAESSPDYLIGVVAKRGRLFLFGSRSVEVWYNTGNPSFPFERVAGATYNVGAVNRDTIAVDGDNIFFVGGNEAGNGSVWMIAGSERRRISTPYIESLIGNYDTSSAFGFAYQLGGHLFYQVTYPSYDRTIVYDATENGWHEKDSNVSSSYVENRLRGASSAFESGTVPYIYAFDNINGDVYKMHHGYNSENGTAIRRIRTFGPIEADGKLVFHHRIKFIVEADHDSSSSYTLSATLEWSDDAGLTWSSPVTVSASVTSGATGQRKELAYNRLGSSRQRYYRITFTGPSARLVLLHAELESRLGTH